MTNFFFLKFRVCIFVNYEHEIKTIYEDEGVVYWSKNWWSLNIHKLPFLHALDTQEETEHKKTIIVTIKIHLFLPTGDHKKCKLEFPDKKQDSRTYRLPDPFLILPYFSILIQLYFRTSETPILCGINALTIFNGPYKKQKVYKTFLGGKGICRS